LRSRYGRNLPEYFSDDIEREIRPLRNEAAIYFTSAGTEQDVRERTARVLDPSIFFGLLALTAFTTVPYGTVHAWWVAVFECTVFALTALWIFESSLGQLRRIPAPAMQPAIIILVMFAVAQILPWRIVNDNWKTISADPYETWRFCVYLSSLLLTGMLLHRYTSSPRRLRLLVYVIIGIGVASAAFGIARQMVQGDAYLPLLTRLWPGRGYGQFINQNHFTFLMEMVLGLVLGLLVGGGISRERLFMFVAAAVTVSAALVMSNSRGGIFSMICQLLFLAIMFGVARSQKEISTPRRRAYFRLQRFSKSLIARTLLIVSLLSVVVVSIAWLGGDQLAQRMETVERDFSMGSSEVRANVTRWDIWSATWKSIKDHPILGVGFGAYSVAISKYHDGSGDMRPRQAHNDYLDLLASGGVIGLSLFAWFIIAFIKQLPGPLRSRDPFRRSACLGALVGVFGVAVHSLVDFGLHITTNALIFISLIVIATVNGRVEERRFSKLATN
jgi:O-antigen ligase